MKEKISEKFYEVIEKYDFTGDTNSAVVELREYLLKSEIKNFEISVDVDVYDSPGLDIYYIMLAWNDADGLHLLGSSLYRE